MSQESFVVGSTVQLNSGGPVMSVIAVGPVWYGTRAEKTQVLAGHVLAAWFDGVHQKSATFPIAALHAATQQS